MTENLQNTAERFKNRMDPRMIASNFTRDPRNATQEMVQTKPKTPAVKPTAPKKPKVNKVGNVETAFFTNQSSGQQNRLRKQDSISDVAGKLLNFITLTEDERKKHFELNRNFEKENLEEDKRRHNELVEALKKQREEKPKVEEKKPEEKKPEEKKKEEAKKPEAKKEEVKKTEPTKAPAKTAEPVKPAEPVKAPEVKPTTAKPVEAPTPSTPTVTIPKPSISTGVSTAAKVGVGVAALAAAGISSAAALSIERETGKPASQAIKSVGQIVPNDPKAGVTSYGIFGINSQGSVQSFVQENPNFGLVGKPATKEFDEQWSKVSKERAKEMLDAQLAWYDNHITKPLNKDLSTIIPKQFADNPKVITYFSDRRVQYGKTMENQAVSYASTAKTPEEFLTLITEYDLSHLKDAFKTYLSNHPDAIKGLEKRVKEREKYSLNTNNEIGNKLAQSSVTNQDLKKQGTSGNTVAIDNTQTNVSTMGNQTPNQILSSARRPDLPLHQQG